MATRASINKKIKKLQRKSIQCESKAETLREKAEHYMQLAAEFNDDADECDDAIRELKREGLGETK